MASEPQVIEHRAWVRENPAEAFQVLLETGALQPEGFFVYKGPDEPPEWAYGLYRLVTEENRD